MMPGVTVCPAAQTCSVYGQAGSPGAPRPYGHPGDAPSVRGDTIGPVRVIVTRIESGGTMQRRMVDTAQRGDGPQWENLGARALTIPPLYRPVPAPTRL